MTTKMKKSAVLSFLLSVCFGIYLHFAYELSNYNRVVGLFAPINESPWEHLKLLLIPFTLFTIIQYFLSKRNSKNILFRNSIAVLIGMVLIISLYYTIHGAIGIHGVAIDIFIYILSTAVTYILCYYYAKNNTFPINNIYGFILFILLFLLFFLFTFRPPRIPMFQDSVTKSFGIIHQQGM